MLDKKEGCLARGYAILRESQEAMKNQVLHFHVFTTTLIRWSNGMSRMRFREPFFGDFGHSLGWLSTNKRSGSSWCYNDQEGHWNFGAVPN